MMTSSSAFGRARSLFVAMPSTAARVASGSSARCRACVWAGRQSELVGAMR